MPTESYEFHRKASLKSHTYPHGIPTVRMFRLSVPFLLLVRDAVQYYEPLYQWVSPTRATHFQFQGQHQAPTSLWFPPQVRWEQQYRSSHHRRSTAMRYVPNG